MENGIYEELHSIYSNVPEGNCIGCGNCCHESVGASFVEADIILKKIKKMNKTKREKLIKKIFEYYFNIYETREKCPFLGFDNLCDIYDDRPLNCRIYGHWSESDYNNNYERIKTENTSLERILKNKYGYSTKMGYVDFHIPYCKNFKGNIMTKNERNILYDKMISLDSKKFVSQGITTAYEDKGIVEHIVDMLFGKEKIFNLKMKNRLTPGIKRRILEVAKLRIEG